MKERVYRVIAEQLNKDPEDLSRDLHFVEDLNMDSIELVEMVMSLEEEFDVQIDEDRLEGIQTIGDVLDLLETMDIEE
ncbi:Acyl carrier protein [Aedoeadaptatus ivorii]|uniref:Acyl carrier protein n=1 Tax=Aedoeadaptatus ivorii TaxID=54006 RepID=A0A448V1T2_9FIRM|nr:acyl carrier protein [Peptoniphilus ivorii]MDQ0507889.1 acyl carrier protein [Peptoniphilus ivorii]VEJ35715.1 Acyl carrier protein [Peptoniphilus ivorii]